MKKTTLLLTLATTILFSCNNETLQESETPKTDSLETKTQSDLREPNDEEIEEFGILAGLEDSGYPRHILTMEFPERQSKADFQLNIEAIEMDIETLSKLEGKYIKIYYTTEFSNNLMDVQQNGKSIFSEEEIEVEENWKSVTGILTGADKVTNSDLPGSILVTPKEGEAVSIELFVDSELVPYNNREVTIFYSSKGYDNITFIAPTKE